MPNDMQLCKIQHGHKDNPDIAIGIGTDNSMNIHLLPQLDPGLGTTKNDSRK